MNYKNKKKNISIVKNAAQFELNILIYRFIRLNFNFPFIYRQRCLLLLSKYNQKFNFNKLLNYCLETGKFRFILKNLKISRMSLKSFNSSSFLVGFYKSS